MIAAATDPCRLEHLAVLHKAVDHGFDLWAVAAYLARHRHLAGLILVTPFDFIVELARDHYPWLPVRLLLRHRMPTVDFVRDMPTPTALIVAGSDTIVPPGRSEPLRRAISNLVSDAKIDEAGHNDLFDRAAFSGALREALARIERRQPSAGTSAPPAQRQRRGEIERHSDQRQRP